METGVNNAFFLYPFLCPTLSHQLINIRNGDDDEALIVLHAGYLHQHIERIVSHDPAVGQFNYLVFIQSLLEIPDVQSL